MPRGGSRQGAGRPKGQGKYGEKTKAIRVPISKVRYVAEIISKGLYEIPLYGSSVAAGFPSPADDYIEDKIDINKYLIKHPASTFLVRATGESMINVGIFPNDILMKLSAHLLNPAATTVRDIELTKVLKKYDNKDVITVSEILDGDEFKINNGQQFIRICKLRKNYKCQEISTQKLYRFSPLSEITPL